MSASKQTEAELIADLTNAGRVFIEMGATLVAFLDSHRVTFPEVSDDVWDIVEYNLRTS